MYVHISHTYFVYAAFKFHKLKICYVIQSITIITCFNGEYLFTCKYNSIKISNRYIINLT